MQLLVRNRLAFTKGTLLSDGCDDLHFGQGFRMYIQLIHKMFIELIHKIEPF